MCPYLTAIWQLKFLMVGIDYFTKWVEAEALAMITKKNVRSFVWKNIVCKYGIPKVLVLDNRKQFDNDAFKDFCLQLGIKNHYSSPAHPQANGQVEVRNRSLLKIIKTWARGGKGYMAWRITNHFMGLQGNRKNSYNKDSILCGLWKQGSHPYWSWMHKLQSEKLCRE